MTGFSGYHRPDGRVGIRNRLLVLSVGGLTGPTSRRIAAGLRDAACIVLPYEAGLIGFDKITHDRAALGLASHPNVGAALLIGDNRQVLVDLSDLLTKRGQPHAILSLEDCGNDAIALQASATRLGAGLIRQMSLQRRAPAPLSALVAGLECGRSDPSSGLVANPLLGVISDRLIAAGGTTILGETTEWLGGEERLCDRAASPAVANAIRDAVHRREQAAITAGVDLQGRNPTPVNIQSGLTTIEEKSLGSIAKSGSSRIEGVLDYAEAPSHTGLWVMDAPAFAPESLTGFVAAGAQVMLFTTGVGNSYVSALAPTIKISANPESCERVKTQFDFCADAGIAGTCSLAALADDLLERILGVMQGDLTWGEILGEGDEVVSRFGPSL